MILITGSTGFIGQVLIRQLTEAGYPVRVLLRPSPKTPTLPSGIPVEASITTLDDPNGLEAAFQGVDTIIHLIGGEWQGAAANLMEIDVQSTRRVLKAAKKAKVNRIFFLSHLGVDRYSAYPVLKAKALAEADIRKSGIDYTIIRTALVYGPGDKFTSGLARLLRATPFFFFLPGKGDTLIQPVWVEDLVTALVWAIEDPNTINQTIEVGGPEQLMLRDVVKMVMEKSNGRRAFISLHPDVLRRFTVFLDAIFPRLPVSVLWLNYFAANRTTGIDSFPRNFGLMPSRFSHRIDYLSGVNWRRELLRSIFRKP